MFQRPLVDELNRWSGHAIEVARGELRRPAFRMEVANGWRLRMSCKGEPILWARTWEDFYGYSYVRAHAEGFAGEIVRPIRADECRAIGEAAPDDRMRLWVDFFARLLIESPLSPLHEGTWYLGPYYPEAERRALSFDLPPSPELKPSPFELESESEWDIGDYPPPFRLRPEVPKDHGRVKAMRKLVREGVAPPILLLWNEGLARYIVLDGHVRWQAMLDETTTPDFILLFATKLFEQGASRLDGVLQVIEYKSRDPSPNPRNPLSQAKANSLINRAQAAIHSRCSTSWAWPIEGGIPAWVGEVTRVAKRADVRECLLRA
jgi:hypothetical protein